MFRRTIFIELFAVMLTLPAFSFVGFGPELSGTRPETCNENYLGVKKGATTLKARWIPKVYEFVLDDNFYTSGDDVTGQEPTEQSEDDSIFSRYEEGVYSDSTSAHDPEASTAEDPKTSVSVPSKTGYNFTGFYTKKFSGGTQVVSADGTVLPEAKEVVGADGAPVTWYAQWTPRTYDCAAGYYLDANYDDCQKCAAGSYCGGFNTPITYDGANHGMDGCPTNYTSDAGAKAETECYTTDTVACADANPYNLEHGTVRYANENVTCKKYYGNESDCVTETGACAVVGLNCDTGYVYDTTTNSCVLDKITCEPGKYLPAGTRTCAVCVANNYCLGGSFDPEPATDMGITACESGLVSPAGSQRATDCGHVLNINGSRVYLHAKDDDEHTTHPSFVTEIDGQRWYGDMTEVSDACTKTMSDDTNTTWHVEYKNKEYTVHGRYVTRCTTK